MYYGNEVVIYQGKGIMHLFLTQDTQVWDVNPHIKVQFDSGILRLFSSIDPIHGLVTEMQANTGDVFSVKVSEGETPTLEKVSLPERRGDKILWALGFTEESKRMPSHEAFVINSQQYITENQDTRHNCIFTYENVFSFHVSRKITLKGKGHSKTHQSSYKLIVGWCSDSISEENIQYLIRKYKKYRKINCPIEFFSVI